MGFPKAQKTHAARRLKKAFSLSLTRHCSQFQKLTE